MMVSGNWNTTNYVNGIKIGKSSLTLRNVGMVFFAKKWNKNNLITIGEMLILYNN